MRNITSLLNEGDIVFIKVRHEAMARKLWQDAISQGFMIDGKVRLEDIKMHDTVYWLHDDFTINSISGFASHMFYGSMLTENNGKTIARIDYGKYISGYDNYHITTREDL